MKKFIIERELPGAGKLTNAELKAITQKSCDVVDHLETHYYWIETFVTDNKLYCVHIAPDEETVKEHARRGGFPADRISEIKSILDPMTELNRI